ncbi:nucleotidyl transferase AbiEii/AbiGii toxin family protein [Thermodesulfobacteriota bacterium]
MLGNFYQHKLYPFQDMILQLIQKAGVDFYLTGGTVLCRFYLNHRYSDDLDFFVNAVPDFKDQVKTAVDGFKKAGLQFEVGTTSETFVRIFSESERISLKIDFVNDVPFHYGDFESSRVYNKIDNWRNILSNKICALSRLEAKDIADILFIAKSYQFSWEEIIREAREKDLWVEPLEVSKMIGSFSTQTFQMVKWIQPIEANHFDKVLKQIQKDIFYGNDNSLF